MKLNKKQKDIVRLINEHEITDIYSFVMHYDLGTHISHNRSDIVNKFNRLFDGQEYKCSMKYYDFSNDTCIIRQLDNDYALAKPILDYTWCEGQVIGEDPYKQGFSLFDDTYICENTNEIISFISLWQYLKSEGLIIELPKQCLRKDMGLFLRKEAMNNDVPNLSTNPKLELSDMEIKALYFMDWKFCLDNLNFQLCLPYLEMKIYPAPALTTFINKKYNTKEELNNNRNLLIALIGVIIAIITSAASIVMSFNDEGYHKELNYINQSIQELNQDRSTETIHEPVLDTQ